jgi:eukaryotic-like serine/threonine-protein kinase
LAEQRTSGVQTRVGTTLCGKYHVDEFISKGSMAAVYAASHRNGQKVALKVLHAAYSKDESLRTRFLREGYLANSVDHPGTVKVIDDEVTEDGCAFLVMELLIGDTLEDVRKKAGGRIPLDRAIGFADQLLGVLEAANKKGIVHRDIKPENIFMHVKEDGGEIVKLLDFGISKMTGEGEEHATQAGTLLGTPTFMAPEQVRTGPISPQTDMWAIGMVAHRFLVGRNYWPKASTGELMALILVRPMELPSTHPGAEHLGGAYDAWFMRSCDRDPQKRWASVAEQVSALSDALRLAKPPASQHYAPPPPATSTAVIAPNMVHSHSTPSIGTGASAVTNGAVTTGATAPPSKSSSTITILIAGATLFTVVAYGASRLMNAHVASKTNASAASTASAPLVDAPVATSVSQPAIDPSIALPQATAISSAAPTVSASASAAPVAATATPTSTHARSQSTAEKKPVSATHNAAEDPWAR